MNIDLHTICYNESDIVKLILGHYKKFCRNMFVYDNHSTDGSQELCQEMGAKVIPFGKPEFSDRANMDLKNNCWKGSDADWVIVCDFDEVIFCNESIGIKQWLDVFDDVQLDVSIIKTIGWQIISEQMPKDDLLEITNGYRFDNYSKSIFFRPDIIQEINYGPGAHEIKPIADFGVPIFSESELYVLHYKHIGGVERTIKRYRECGKRMSKENRQKGWGIHNFESPGKLREQWAERMAKSKPLI